MASSFAVIFAFTLFLGSIFVLANGLKCTSQLVSTRPGINGTDPVEKDCNPNTKQCISAKCSFADQSHVIATGCKESSKGSCKDAQLECEKAEGKLEQCKCEPGEECKNDKGRGNDGEL
ncbi:hypothetical protein niasHS_008514 [Heterodera schachtii]|uniref:Uncharacterized protein n=2 Tax=Heterodera TaxID=34509 RepID=A0ABD2JEV7_HETSC